MQRFLLAVATLAPICHGSVGVVYFGVDKIIIAADSRGSFPDGRPPRNDQCKVSAIDGKILIVSINSGQFDATRPDLPSWSNASEARRSYDAVLEKYSSVQGRLRDIAIGTAEALKSRFLYLYSKHRTTFDRAAGKSGSLTKLFMGGAGINGLELYEIEIIAAKQTAQSAVESHVARIGCQSTQNICAIGRVDIAEELLAGKTERSRAAAVAWSSGDPSKFHDLRRVVRIIELTIQHDASGTVGGPIDAVQLNPDGSIEWYARKRNCPEN